MKTIGIIPARGGSKGIYKKNIKILFGKPLIFYTIEAALKSNLDRVIVSTDDPLIKEISINYGAEVIDRPADFANDDTPTLPVIQHAISKVDIIYNAFMVLQPTSPLRTYIHINEAIDLFENNEDADSLVSVVKVPHHFTPEKIMTYDGNFLKGNLKIDRRQEVNSYYARNGAAIYLTRIERINQFIIGGNILPYFMNKLDSIDIDDDEDFRIAEMFLKFGK